MCIGIYDTYSKGGRPGNKPTTIFSLFTAPRSFSFSSQFSFFHCLFEVDLFTKPRYKICLPFSFAWSSHIGISIYFRFAKYSYGLISSNKDGFKTNFSLKQKTEHFRVKANSKKRKALFYETQHLELLKYHN